MIPGKKLRAFVERESPKKRRPEDEEDDRAAAAEGEKDKGKVAKFVKEEGDRINGGKQDPELKKLMRDFDPEDNPPQWVVSEAIWERAKEAVDPEGEGSDKYDDPFAVVAHVYKRMGGKVKKGKG